MQWHFHKPVHSSAMVGGELPQLLKKKKKSNYNFVMFYFESIHVQCTNSIIYLQLVSFDKK